MTPQLINLPMLPNLDNMNIAVAVMTFDRPQYLERCINYLETCHDIGRVDWIFFQDGAVNKFSGERRADDTDITKSISLIKEANLPNKEIRTNAHNMGNAIQTDKAYRLLNEKYEAVIRLEEDVLTSRYFVRVIMSLLTQFSNCVPTLYGKGSISDKNLPDDLDKVQIGSQASFTITAMSDSIFRDIQDRWNDFIDIADGYDWLPSKRPDVMSEFQVDYANGVDGALNAILKEHGYHRVAPTVSRASHIGREGMNMTPSQYDNEFGHGDEGQLTYEIDNQPPYWEVKHDFTTD